MNIPAEIHVNGKWRPTRNSEGRLIHPTPEGLLAFWKWFGESKVVDDQGRPLVVYHGSPHTFQSFRSKQDGGGMFLSPSSEFAEEYAENYVPGGQEGIHLHSLYARLLNPFDYADEKMRKAALEVLVEWGIAEPDGRLNDGFTMQEVAKGSFSAIEGVVMLQYIRDQHDGFYVKEDGILNLAIFSPTQIKSATGNRGTFDGADPVLTNPRRRRQR